MERVAPYDELRFAVKHAMHVLQAMGSEEEGVSLACSTLHVALTETEQRAQAALDARPTADPGEDEDLIAKLRAWPAVELGKDALSAAFVATLMEQAAGRLILYREAREGLADKIAEAMQQARDEIGATEQQRIAFGYAEAAMRDVLSKS